MYITLVCFPETIIVVTNKTHLYPLSNYELARVVFAFSRVTDPFGLIGELKLVIYTL